jgi:hypothetical protein
VIEQRFAIVGDWLCLQVDQCTCGSGGTGYGHESGCGWDAVAKLDPILAVVEPVLRQRWEAELMPDPQSVVEKEESTLRGALGMARARYELLIIACHEAEQEGRSLDEPMPRRRRPTGHAFNDAWNDAVDRGQIVGESPFAGKPGLDG